jgi:very-short-patch-repair endonuclease
MAFQQRLVDLATIDATLGRLQRVRRRRLIEVTARDAEAGSEALSELDFLRLCRRGRLPVPTRQSTIMDRAGRRRYRDAYFAEWRLHVEIDGGQHMDVATWWADMRRQNDIWVAGDRILRFPAWAIRNHPDEVIDQIRAALIAAGWRPPQSRSPQAPRSPYQRGK